MESETSDYGIPGSYIYDNMVVLKHVYPNILDKIMIELDVSENHVITTCYPKCGSTQVNAMIYLMKNNFDIEMAATKHPLETVNFIDVFGFKDNSDLSTSKSIKSHLPLRYYLKNIDKLEKGPKLVVSMRNPKDTLISYYHFYRSSSMYGNYKGTWDEFFGIFKKKGLAYGDIFQYNKTIWQHKDHPNIHIIKFENLRKNFDDEVRKLAEFLDIEMTDTQLEDVKRALSFENMSKTMEHHFSSVMNTSISKFFRMGIIGDWHNYFTKEQSDYIDDLCETHWDPIGLHFDYEYSD